ncbi:flavodoxin [Arenicella chitinivorans]|uniref:Flavodoxin n=1 Tax=Arenicella chitinivorans TaxID=1329800 RepID=A0A918RSS7_9GAMM|nr:NAD(P)H-dependent oxidoreductase [Arenicella chitinivorans]GHA08798.1 flavodoxin [Arenicella chitinivorans]
MPKANKTLLIVAHTPSPNTRALAHALLGGVNAITEPTLNCELKSPFECEAENVLNADALILFTTENFGAMSGALKDFFERIYYPCLDQPARNEAKPYALVIRAGLDGSGTEIGVHRITTGLKWREAQDVLLCRGEYTRTFLPQCQQLGETMAALLVNDIL